MTQTANDRQVGGDHYQKKEYQHWDWVCDINLHYLLGCATKYVARWRDKNGVQDLEKALHYIDKAEERGVRHSGEPQITLQFATQHPNAEANAIMFICAGEFDLARHMIKGLIAADLAQESSKPEPRG